MDKSTTMKSTAPASSSTAAPVKMAWAKTAANAAATTPAPTASNKEQHRATAVSPAKNGSVSGRRWETAAGTTTTTTTATAAAVGKTNGGKLSQQDQSMRDRLVFFLTNLIGLTVYVHRKDGAKFEGIFHGVSGAHGAGVALKKVRRLQQDGLAVQDPLQVTEHMEFTDWTQIVAKQVDLSLSSQVRHADEQSRKGFQTDTSISGNIAGKERELKKWVAEDHGGAGGLEEEEWSTMNPSGTRWDQFEANEKLFGVTTDFNEDFYTTKLDKNSEFYKRREKEAERKAHEIEKGITSNVHVAEERGAVIDDSQMDEEDRYGAVVRNPGAYVPPHGRKPAAATKVAEKQPVNASGNAHGGKTANNKAPSTIPPPTANNTLQQPPAPKKTWAAISAPAPALAGKVADLAKPSPPAAIAEKKPTVTPDSPSKSVQKQDEKKAKPAVSTSSTGKPMPEPSSAPKAREPSPARLADKKPATAPLAASTTAAKLNPNAPAFTFNLAAAEFKPSFAIPAAVSAPEAVKPRPTNIFGKDVPTDKHSVLSMIQENMKTAGERKSDQTSEVAWPYGEQSYRAQLNVPVGPPQGEFSPMAQMPPGQFFAPYGAYPFGAYPPTQAAFVAPPYMQSQQFISQVPFPAFPGQPNPYGVPPPVMPYGFVPSMQGGPYMIGAPPVPPSPTAVPPQPVHQEPPQ